MKILHGRHNRIDTMMLLDRLQCGWETIRGWYGCCWGSVITQITQTQTGTFLQSLGIVEYSHGPKNGFNAMIRSHDHFIIGIGRPFGQYEYFFFGNLDWSRSSSTIATRRSFGRRFWLTLFTLILFRDITFGINDLDDFLDRRSTGSIHHHTGGILFIIRTSGIATSYHRGIGHALPRCHIHNSGGQ